MMEKVPSAGEAAPFLFAWGVVAEQSTHHSRKTGNKALPM
jgi:hypothetical protein